jgi:hypothetical protein
VFLKEPKTLDEATYLPEESIPTEENITRKNIIIREKAIK